MNITKIFHSHVAFLILNLCKNELKILIVSGVTLSEKEPLAQYEMEEPTTTAEDQKLVIKQICLGAEAKDDEFNVVQVSALLTNAGVNNEQMRKSCRFKILFHTNEIL